MKVNPDLSISEQLRQLIQDYRAYPDEKRIYRLRVPKRLWKRRNDTSVWQPKKVTVRQGIIQMPHMILFGYLLVILVSVFINTSAIFKLPATIRLATMFSLSSRIYPTIPLCIGAIIFEMYLIYRDIVHRSLSSYFLVVPMIFCIMNMVLLLQIL